MLSFVAGEKPAGGCEPPAGLMRIPNAELAIVDIRKLRDYCLNPEHDEGKHKARLFKMANKIKLFNVVSLTVDLPKFNLWQGQVGTVVEILAGGSAYEVEFCDRDGRSYESLGLRPDQIMVLHYEPAGIASETEAVPA